MESVPPATTTSPLVKLVDDSLKVNVMVLVCDADRLVALVVIAMVGGVVSGNKVSTVMVTLLFASEPSTLTLPAASVKAILATLITPLTLLFAAGVNKAV